MAQATKKPRKPNRESFHYCVTCFKLDLDFEALKSNLNIRFFCYNTEICPKTGKEHYQMYFQFYRMVHYTVVQTYLQDKAHCSLPKHDVATQIRYCTKEDTRKPGTQPFLHGEPGGPEDGYLPSHQGKRMDLIQGIQLISKKRSYKEVCLDLDTAPLAMKYPQWTKAIVGTSVPLIPNPEYDTLVLYDWQKRLLKYLEEPVKSRRIFWIWSFSSGTGKSTFFGYLCQKLAAVPLPLNHDNAVHLYEGEKIVVFDLPRAVSDFSKHPDILFNLEKFSNSYNVLVTGKYEGKRIQALCHVVVFANVPPPSIYMTRDYVEIETSSLQA